MAKFFVINPGFELGDQDWQKGTAWVIAKDAPTSRSGVWRAVYSGSALAALGNNPAVQCRPGANFTISAWVDSSIATAGTVRVSIHWRDKDDVGFSTSTGGSISFGGGGYAQAIMSAVAPDRTKFAFLRVDGDGSDGSTWYIDDFDATGDIIESIPTTAKIQSHSMLLARTIGRFDPLIGADKFTEFNAGMSDKWAGVFTFIPEHPSDDLGELLSFLERLGQIERFFAFDPDRLVPKNGIVNGMTVDGPITSGTNKIPVKAGPVSSTALVAGDYMEVKDQYFQLQRDLEIGPEATGEAIVVPAVRSTLADGEDVITDNPKMIARVTSEVPRRSDHDKWTQLSMSWEEV